MDDSGYVLAGYDTLAKLLHRFTTGLKAEDRWNNQFTKDSLQEFFNKVCVGFLYSFGQNFPNKRKYHKYKYIMFEGMRFCRDTEFFKGSKLFLDSGGYQISIGRLSKRESKILFDMYYEWLQEFPQMYDRAFILDVPPGPGCRVFNDFYDVYKWNYDSYMIAKNLPKEVKDKLVYVHHFRTPKLWEIYTKIMRENELFKEFNFHATGGIVANLVSDMIIPCFIYTIPLIPLINECKKYKRDFLNFHILGGAGYRDVLFYELIKRLVLDVHKIKLNVTYDSSGAFKQVMFARYMWVKDGDGHLRKMDIRSSNLQNRFYGEERVIDTYQRMIDELTNENNFKKINIDEVYMDNEGSMYEDVKIYSIMYALHRYHTVKKDLEVLADEIYPLYKEKHYDAFYHRCIEATRLLNQGKLTSKQETKAHSFIRSLDMLVELDEDYCQFLVNKFLAKDEFVQLFENKRIMTI
jgi:hypothetical protein